MLISRDQWTDEWTNKLDIEESIHWRILPGRYCREGWKNKLVVYGCIDGWVDKQIFFSTATDKEDHPTYHSCLVSLVSSVDYPIYKRLTGPNPSLLTIVKSVG